MHWDSRVSIRIDSLHSSLTLDFINKSNNHLGVVSMFNININKVSDGKLFICKKMFQLRLSVQLLNSCYLRKQKISYEIVTI